MMNDGRWSKRRVIINKNEASELYIYKYSNDLENKTFILQII